MAGMQALLGLARMSSECLDPNCHSAHFFGIAYAAIDDEAMPTIGESQLREIPADQGAAPRCASINDENPAIAGFFEQRSNRGVVLEHLDCNYAAGEGRFAAEIAKQGFCDLCFWVGIRQIGGC